MAKKKTKTKKKLGRPKTGRELRISHTCRIEPSKKEKLIERYGSVQTWFDKKLVEEFEGFEAIVERKTKTVEFEPDFEMPERGRDVSQEYDDFDVSPDDF